MKKVFAFALVAGMASLVACGPSEAEKQAAEKAKQDSIAAAEQARMDSIAAAEAAAVDTAAHDTTAAAAPAAH
jgi:hypothetical protein